MFVVLIALGVWQVRRLAWKEGLIAQIAEAEARPAVPLAATPPAFAKVMVQGRLREDLGALYGAEVRDTPQGQQMGAQLIVPLERAGAEDLLVDRGWVPLARQSPIDLPSVVGIEGFVRPGDAAHWFSAQDDAAERHFYTLDPAAIGAALGLAHVAPFTLVALGPAPPGGYPDPARQLPRPPNDHLSYAITWFSLAGVLVIVFALWTVRTLRNDTV